MDVEDGEDYQVTMQLSYDFSKGAVWNGKMRLHCLYSA